MVYHLLANPKILSKLQNELKAPIPDPSNLPALASLEGLPYLVSLCSFRVLTIQY